MAARRVSRAGSQAPGVPNRAARSTWKPIGDEKGALGEAGVRGPRGGARARVAPHGGAQWDGMTGRLRQGKKVPAEPVDSTGVPARSCLWIPTDLVRVLSVFSFKFNPACTTGIPQHPKALQIVCNTSHTIVCPTPQTSAERFLFGLASGLPIFDRYAGTKPGLQATHSAEKNSAVMWRQLVLFIGSHRPLPARTFGSGWLECYDQGFGGIA